MHRQVFTLLKQKNNQHFFFTFLNNYKLIIVTNSLYRCFIIHKSTKNNNFLLVDNKNHLSSLIESRFKYG